LAKVKEEVNLDVFQPVDKTYPFHVNGFDRNRIFSSRKNSRTSFVPIVAAFFIGTPLGIAMYLVLIYQVRKTTTQHFSIMHEFPTV